MSFLLTVVGVLLLVPSVAGVALGAYMSTHPKTRESGRLFALLWVPAVAAAVGVLLRDPVTFIVGAVCFVVAGIALYISGRITAAGKPTARRTTSENRRNSASPSATKEKPPRKPYRRAAS